MLFIFAIGRQRNTLFFLQFICLFVYSALLRNDFIQTIFRSVFCAAKTSPTIILVFSALQKASRQLFLLFLRCKNVPDDRFCVFCAAESFPMIDFAFSAPQKCSRRLFWCFLRCKKKQNDRFCSFVKRKIHLYRQ